MTTTRLACRCKTCKTNGARPVLVPDTFAPAVPRKTLTHGVVFQANHPVLGAGFRAQTGVVFA